MSKKQTAKLCTKCGNHPICPPSKVICRPCMDGITATMEQMLARMTEREKGQRK